MSNHKTKNVANSSLLTLLDEKTRTIEVLQKQVENQKLQLRYYIRKELKPTKIQEISEKCCGDSIEESIPLTLAMTKFINDTGIQTKNQNIYRKMMKIDKKIDRVLGNQQEILKWMVKSIFKNTENKIGRTQPAWLNLSPIHIDIFNKLMHKTIILNRSLNVFRICCNRLLVQEDERNTIVEQVYSKPIQERVDCNILANVYMERLRLENDIENILKQQNSLKSKVEEIIYFNKRIKHVHFPDEKKETLITFSELVLHKINQLKDQACGILNKTMKQKPKLQVGAQFEKHTVLKIVTAALEQLRLQDFVVPKHYTRDEQNLFKNVLSMLDMQINAKAVKRYVAKVNQCRILQNELQSLYLERDKLTCSMNELEKELQKLKLKQSVDALESWQRGQNALQSKEDTVKDSGMQCEALDNSEHRFAIKEKNLKILELENINKTLENQKEQYQSIISRNKTQIINLLKNSIPKTTKDISTEQDNKPYAVNSKLSIALSQCSLETYTLDTDYFSNNPEINLHKPDLSDVIEDVTYDDISFVSIKPSSKTSLDIRQPPDNSVVNLLKGHFSNMSSIMAKNKIINTIYPYKKFVSDSSSTNMNDFLNKNSSNGDIDY